MENQAAAKHAAAPPATAGGSALGSMSRNSNSLTNSSFHTLAQQVIGRCQKLAVMSEDLGSTRRTFLSPPMHECHREIASWLAPLGVSIEIDAVGNLRGSYPGTNPNSGRLLIGSHLDTVPNAGAYDGILGVVLAVGLLEALQGRKFPFAIEVVGFSEEEGVRFGIPFIGSRALIGAVDESLLRRTDSNGISIKEAIRQFGLDSQRICDAALRDDVFGYLEFHIEQGPVLESLDLALAAVDAIAGQSRLEFIFCGRSNHAGTTPMHLRRDALAAAAQWIGIVETQAQKIEGLVATVASITAKAGATNVIAGEVRASLDVRHALDDVRRPAVGALIEQANETAARRGVSVTHSFLLDQRAVTMDKVLVGQVEAAIRKTGCKPHRMVSGAGHDAMILAEKVPAAMVFLRSPGGISHHPAETVRVEDVAKALECGLHLLDQLASSPNLYRRTALA